MISTLATDIQAFVNSRLDRVGETLKDSPDYRRENDNIERMSSELLTVSAPEQAVTLQDIDDSYTTLVNVYENACYRQGFRDGLRFLAEI